MNFFKKYVNRFTFVSLLLLIQLIWIVLIPIYLSRSYYWLSVIFNLISIVVVALIINKRSDPAIKLAWAVPILLFPLLGGIIYLLFGSKVTTLAIKKKIEKHTEVTIKKLPDSSEIIKSVASSHPHLAGQMSYVASNGFPVYANTAVKYYPTGEDWFPDLIEELKKAEKFIFIEFFILKEGQMWDEILSILEQKVALGVDVRVMYDDFGSINHLPSKYYKKLRSKGIKAIAFNRYLPFLSIVMNNRDHRKIVVIDGNVGFTGGANIADEYINRHKRFGNWKDAVIMLKGDATASLTALFLEMWNGARHTDNDIENYLPGKVRPCSFEGNGLVQPYGDSPLDSEILGENVYLSIINGATSYIYIFTPYLIIDHTLSEALRLAAKRGVDVRIVIPEIPDKKVIYQLTLSHCPALLDAGVKIYKYTPGFIHSKCFVSDDKVATVGTVNLDYRSLLLHFECGCLIYNSSAILDIKDDFIKTAARSAPLSFKRKKRGIIKNFYYALLRLFAPLF